MKLKLFERIKYQYQLWKYQRELQRVSKETNELMKNGKFKDYFCENFKRLPTGIQYEEECGDFLKNYCYSAYQYHRI